MNDHKNLNDILKALHEHRIDIDQAQEQIKTAFEGVEDLGFARFDTDRKSRTGVAEVIFGSGKTKEQLLTLLERSLAHHRKALATRVNQEQAHFVKENCDLLYDENAQLLHSPFEDAHYPTVGILSAGTSDQKVAGEAAAVLRYLGHDVDSINDVGVAGIHRLFGVLDRIRTFDVLIVVAGMEGALPSVVAGLVQSPVIAVPTSIGYGANFNGLSALLGMLTSCAAGIAVVNIDNGFGAAMLAHRISSTKNKASQSL